MSKMSELSITLQDYEDSLYSNGHLDPLTIELKRELISYQVSTIDDLVRGIELDFDIAVFNNQTEGRF